MHKRRRIIRIFSIYILSSVSTHAYIEFLVCLRNERDLDGLTFF